RARNQRRSRKKSQPDFFHRRVKRHRKTLVNPIFRLHLKYLRFSPDQVAHAAMLDLDPLRLSSRPGGVDDVGQIAWICFSLSLRDRAGVEFMALMARPGCFSLSLGDHIPRSGRLLLGNKLVAGLGSHWAGA